MGPKSRQHRINVHHTVRISFWDWRAAVLANQNECAPLGSHVALVAQDARFAKRHCLCAMGFASPPRIAKLKVSLIQNECAPADSHLLVGMQNLRLAKPESAWTMGFSSLSGSRNLGFANWFAYRSGTAKPTLHQIRMSVRRTVGTLSWGCGM